MFGPFSGWEILIILFVVLLIFGPGRLGELGKSLGEGIRNFKKAVSGEDTFTTTQNTNQPAQPPQQTAQHPPQGQTEQQQSQNNPPQENKQA
jgi:sec-independent protein translocase protein TatA